MSTTSYYESFGSGLLIAKNLAANSQPIVFGALQDITLDMSRTTKELWGTGQFPLAIGAGQMKCTGSAKIGQISGPVYSSLFFGSAGSAGTVKIAYAEAASVPAASPYTVTVANSATFVDDLGVIYSATGVPLVPVASSPTTGEYSFAAGVYTFAAADTGLAVLINYTYSSASVGSTVNLGNPLQGVQPTFSIILQRSSNGVGERFKAWSCISSKLSLPTKMADWGISQFDFSCFADASGRTLTAYTDV